MLCVEPKSGKEALSRQSNRCMPRVLGFFVLKLIIETRKLLLLLLIISLVFEYKSCRTIILRFEEGVYMKDHIFSLAGCFRCSLYLFSENEIVKSQNQFPIQTETRWKTNWMSLLWTLIPSTITSRKGQCLVMIHWV